MKTTTIYAADVVTNMENAVRQMRHVPNLAMHSALPITTQEMTRYLGQILTKDEQAVCDMATD